MLQTALFQITNLAIIIFSCTAKMLNNTEILLVPGIVSLFYQLYTNVWIPFVVANFILDEVSSKRHYYIKNVMGPDLNR